MIERKPTEHRSNLLFKKEKSKSSIKNEQIIDEDQITKLNVHSNIRAENLKLFRDDEI